MSGAWEIQANNQVVCGILHVESVPMAWALGIRNLIIPGYIYPVSGAPFDHARNIVCQHVLETGAKWCFFLDSDVVPPRDVILRLMAHNLPIVSGVYCRRSPPHGVPVMQRKGQWVTNYPQNALIEVDVVGAGCLLLRRDFLEKMPPSRAGKRWFDWRSDMAGWKDEQGKDIYSELYSTSSEDFVLCYNARKAGYKVMVDTSIQCRHIGLAEAGYGTFGPVNTVPAA